MPLKAWGTGCAGGIASEGGAAGVAAREALPLKVVRRVGA